MSEIAAIIGAVTTLLIAMGGGAKFLWSKLEKRQKEAKAEVDQRFAAIDEKLAACEAREKAGQARSAAHVTVIELLWQEVERLSPDGSKALRRALKLLTDLKESE